ncbi:uncharacterized protein LOC113352654 [Papaver somniferum]|uniref:uncharacterized protein LOC113352654 n=1 Tax=Papaver somniferum TaxID=3469 RepID=UPI000E700CE0|nr:uncharacterized protein LOC113352654 [Papaver somniferum]
MKKAKEGWAIPSVIPEKEGEPIRPIKEPTPLGEPVMNFVAVEPTQDINLGTNEDPKIVGIGLAVTQNALNIVLLRTDEGVEKPIFYVISENGKQFEGENVRMLFNAFKIKSGKSTPVYPQINGRAEATNNTIACTLKKKLEGHHKGWCEQIPNVLWSYRTIRRDATWMSSFCLTYGAEAVFPTEAILPTTRIKSCEKGLNTDLILAKLDDLEENREIALQHMMNYHQRLAREYNKKVKARSFIQGELVLREIPPYQKGSGGKLEPTWEGPYIVKRVVGNGAYELADCKGKGTDEEVKIIYGEVERQDRKLDHP